MRRKAGDIVVRIVGAKRVQQQERIPAPSVAG
jgi:hypothetical protein